MSGYGEICHPHGLLTIWHETDNGNFDGVLDLNGYKDLYGEIDTLKNHYHDTKKVEELIKFGTIISLGKEFGSPKIFNETDYLTKTDSSPKNKDLKERTFVRLESLMNNECVFFVRDHKNSGFLWKNFDNGKYKHEYVQSDKNNQVVIFKDFPLRKVLLFSYNTFFTNYETEKNTSLVMVFDKNERWNYACVDDDTLEFLKLNRGKEHDLLKRF
ncbi:hypothetical protein [Campylobacter sp. JMF_03 NE3]|uniref:hypothetical protein n=1 Tax=Campylobacter sp. JMF_03 NE3 TaxID=2983831 RepID=UPI0022E9D954|nr:hypothetical protein [Campylobacter sp. JMF_03 NE3]MDA3053606.1 hypothetical protein [Campylobacter sp. JMF_03 NE3]